MFSAVHFQCIACGASKKHHIANSPRANTAKERERGRERAAVLSQSESIASDASEMHHTAREREERGIHPWLKTIGASVNRYGMELVNAKKRKGK